ncbi:hypothetical protein M422DRAFT_254670 [Sphaerobolus stellatus SS14]|uniref:DUF6593 domain-containing protein n=1 Tax=Sphaerobolus stellatus (strain SS14) TaxID=990650 RepID=A0A0C9VUJ7_SPHS4|nr:hypothetical protein M422DRAFT_254670 [Sphaerobolus stellatus SS14]
MNLSFRSSDPLDMVIVDSTNGAVLYHTEMHNVVDQTTRVNKYISGTQEAKVLAEIHWERLTTQSANVLYRGQKLKMSDFLPRQGLIMYIYEAARCLTFIHIHNFFRTRTFVASDGKQYKWKGDSLMKFKLYDPSENLVVESHKQHQGVFHKAQDYNVDVLPPGIPILDDIIVTFIIMNNSEWRLQVELYTTLWSNLKALVNRYSGGVKYKRLQSLSLKTDH